MRPLPPQTLWEEEQPLQGGRKFDINTQGFIRKLCIYLRVRLLLYQDRDMLGPPDPAGTERITCWDLHLSQTLKLLFQPLMVRFSKRKASSEVFVDGLPLFSRNRNDLFSKKGDTVLLFIAKIPLAWGPSSAFGSSCLSSFSSSLSSSNSRRWGAIGLWLCLLALTTHGRRDAKTKKSTRKVDCVFASEEGDGRLRWKVSSAIPCKGFASCRRA